MSDASADPISVDTLVADVMRHWPETIAVFVSQQMACPGCPMAPFVTVEEAARSYGREPAALLDALKSRAAR